MLTDEQQKLWAEYLRKENGAARVEKEEALATFLSALSTLAEEERDAWARDLAMRIADRGEAIPVRMPLFRTVLFPALRKGIVAEEPGYARWLAHFHLHLHHCDDCRDQLPEHLRSRHALYQKAFQQDPSDAVARRHLIAQYAGYFQYALHELPTGVLYGRNGATPEQCDELLADLKEFTQLVGPDARYKEQIESCARHFTAYRDYLRNPGNAASYEQFLTQRGLPLF